jgi:hypothetical protein
MSASAGWSCHYSAVPSRIWQRRSTPPRVPITRKVALLGRVWATAAEVQFALWRHDLPDVVARFALPDGRTRLPPGLLSRAVSRGLTIGIWQPRCLIRSLVLYRLLRGQGDAAELIIGLRDRPTNSDAHAWVELAGWDVGPAPGGAGYEVLTRYPAEGQREGVA